MTFIALLVRNLLSRDRSHGDRHVVERDSRDSSSRGERSSYSKDKDTDLRFFYFAFPIQGGQLIAYTAVKR